VAEVLTQCGNPGAWGREIQIVGAVPVGGVGSPELFAGPGNVLQRQGDAVVDDFGIE
jgi:hypothetical protein